MDTVTGRSRAESQTTFFALLIVLSVLFALGFSIALFGATNQYIATSSDRLVVVAIGAIMLVAGSGGVYRLLT